MCASFRFERTLRSFFAKSTSLNRSRCVCACFCDPFLVTITSLKRSRGAFAACFDPQGSISAPLAVPEPLLGRAGSSRASRESSPRTGRRVRTGGRVRMASPGARPRELLDPLHSSAPAHSSAPSTAFYAPQRPFPPSVSFARPSRMLWIRKREKGKVKLEKGRGRSEKGTSLGRPRHISRAERTRARKNNGTLGQEASGGTAVNGF